MGRYTDSGKVIANYLPAIDLSPLGAVFVSGLADQLDNVYIPMAEDELDRQFGQSMNEETLVDVAMDGSGDYAIVLPHYPIKTVTAVRIVFGYERTIYNFRNIRHLASRFLGLPQDGQANDGQPLPDMFVDRDSGIMNIDLTGSLLSLAAAPGSYPVWQINFPGAPRDVKASYTHGFPAGKIPIDITNAAGMMAASFLEEMAIRKLTGGATSFKIGSVSKTFANVSRTSADNDRAFPMRNPIWETLVDSTIRRWSQKPMGN